MSKRLMMNVFDHFGLGSSSMTLGRVSVWDPKLIIAQIICVESLYYLFHCITLILISGIFYGKPPTIADLFESTLLSIDSTFGWILVISYSTAAVSTAYMFIFIIGRAKHCLDFSVTIHFNHLLLTSNYDKFPTGTSWWVTFISSCIVMSLLSEYWCLKREISPIILAQNINGTGNPDVSGRNGANGGGSGSGDEEIGLTAIKLDQQNND